MSAENRSTQVLGATALCAGIMGAMWLVASLALPVQIFPLVTLALLIALTVICWFDIDHFRIPNWISYPLIAIGLIPALLLPSYPLSLHLGGALAGYGLIWGLNAYWERFRGRAGIGMGDAKLLAAAGAWLGLALLPIVTLVASALGLMTILGIRALKGEALKTEQAFPFGPFLAIGFFAVWVFKAALPFQY